MSEDNDEKLVPVEKWHRILGTIVTVVLFLLIVLNIYDLAVTTVANWSIGELASGNYDNAYIYGTMAIFAIDLQLLILGGGVFFSLIVGWASSDSCGLSEGDKPTKGKPVTDLIVGFLYPIAGAVVMLPLFGVIGFVAGFGRAQHVLSLLESPSINDIVYVHFNTLGAFLMMSYGLYLIGSMPANAVSAFIVSLVSLPHLRREYNRIVHTTPTYNEVPLHEQLNPTIDDSNDQETG